MLDRVERAWRAVATGISFLLFGLGGLLLRVFVFPLLSLALRDRQRRTAAARAVVRSAFRLFIGIMRTLGVLRYEIRGLEKLDREGLLILANHPTLIDTVFLMAFVRSADCIVKGSLADNPFTRGPVRAAGYIHNCDGAQLVEACVASLRSGMNLIIFPEGTRSGRGEGIAFKRGAANVAVRGQRAVTPVLIRCEPLTLGKGEKWWRVPPRRAQFHIEVRDDIDVASFSQDGASEVIAARRLTEYLQNYFKHEVQGC
jgi:1-acyl-sn-glycerol-3-phosphate acyltransferase